MKSSFLSEKSSSDLELTKDLFYEELKIENNTLRLRKNNVDDNLVQTAFTQSKIREKIDFVGSEKIIEEFEQREKLVIEKKKERKTSKIVGGF